MLEKEKSISTSDINISLKYKILCLNTSPENKITIYRKFEEFSEIENNSEEYTKLKNWIKWATDIPHDNIKTQNYCKEELTYFLQHINNRLNEELYGMDKVKEQILMFISSKLLNPTMKKCNLGLVGPPGTGKTAISKLIASVLDFPFEQISFGGVDKPDFLKGHDYTYIGSQPGEIVKCLKRMKYKNGILFLDEYEKISDNKEICSALLHITDPTQNHEYRDQFLSEITIDLSNIWFIYSMNSLPDDSALRDRIFYIDINGYTHTDKIQIIKNYLLPKTLKNMSLPDKSMYFDTGVISYFISCVSDRFDMGVRTIEKAINDIVNKLSFIYSHQNNEGKLNGFSVSFNIDEKIVFPFCITRKIIDKIIDNKNKMDTAMSISMMYI